MNRQRYFEYKGYIGSIEYSRNNRYYHGKILGLDIQIGYKSSTIGTLKINFESSVNQYLENYKKEFLLFPEVPIRITVNVTEFMKHLGMYLDLAEKREIVFTRFQGERMEFYELRPINIEDEDLLSF